VNRRGVIPFNNNNNNNNSVEQSCSQTQYLIVYPLLALLFLALLPRVILAENSLGEFKPVITAAAWVYSVNAEFDDVAESLVEAIEARGMVISYVSQADSMLARTAATIGGRVVYSDAKVLLFCKANLAHRLVEENPHHLVLCPYAMSVYGLAAEPAKIYVGIRAPLADLDEYKAVHQLLVAVIVEALAEQ